MANLADLLKTDLSKGVAIGLGLGAVAMGLAPVLRPFAKEAVKTGILLADKGREWVVEARDSLDEMVAGVRTNLAEAAPDEGAAEMSSQQSDA
ncbi:MAG: DUF5132 domain-containing protein [Gammaproteobacteria bacterium]|nr:DUF5132 domain-containing protein [Gammaproteobacteria bacterium]